MSVYRVYVEKKEGFDIEAKRMENELKNFLNIKSVKNVRILNRYDVEHITDKAYKKALNTIFSEPQSDLLVEELEVKDEFVFAVSYLKGQYDQRADSCEQCIRIIDSQLQPIVQTAKVYLISGDLSEAEKEKIKKSVINPVESEEVSLEKRESLDMTYPVPEEVKVIEGFITFDEAVLETYRKEQGLAMSLEDLVYFQKYFKSINRNPSFTELKVVDTYWSDHCRHTTFMTELTEIEIEEGEFASPIKEALNEYYAIREEVYTQKAKKVTLMDMATIIAKYLKKNGQLKELFETEEINACTIKDTINVDGRDEEYLILFKNETHNHPTEIEPFGGAATCLGGAIRDPLSGRSYVYQAMRVTGAADPNEPIENTLIGKLPQRVITKTAANGYSSYGNQIGLATGEVKEYYHEGYKAKRLEVGAVVGAVKRANVKHEEPKPGDVIILLGGATGRDGCGGATGSSKEHTEDSLHTCGSEVQKGNPVVERKLQRLFRNPEFSRCIKRCNDFGAGGVCVAIGEIAEGLKINLDLVPVKYMGLDATELAISESQERMAIAIDKNDLEKVINLAHEENIEAVCVAEVTENKQLVMTWKGKEVVHIDRSFLDSAGVTQQRQAKVSAPTIVINNDVLTKENILKTLKDLNVGLQKGLGMQFDSTIGANTVLMPYGGKNQLTKENGMVAKVPVLDGETTAATYMTHGFDPYLLEGSPFHGALLAVVESVAKIVALGADYRKTYLSFQEYFERLTNSESWGKPVAALLGALKAQKELGIAAIGGKDSMSGTFENMSVPPTLISFTCNLGDASECISGSLKEVGSRLVLVSITLDNTFIPDFKQMHKAYGAIYELVKKGQVRSSYAIGKGGIVAALSQMAIGNEIGVKVNLPEEIAPFIASYGSLVLEVSDEVATSLDSEIFTVIGETTKAKKLQIDDVKIKLEDIIQNLLAPTKEVFVQKVDVNMPSIDATFLGERKIYVAKQKIARPEVMIPVFPGTNCEMDTRRVFERAGAKVNEVLFLNRTSTDIEESIERLYKGIKHAQIIAFPGGFSAGDEPDGSGKFIASTFRNEKLKEAIYEHLYKEDGLMIGICNGFQVLVKLGLLPYGEIREMDAQCPTLTFNTIGKHISVMAKTKITSVASPWLNEVHLGECYEIPLSHGEGRFVAPNHVLNELIAKGQVFSQYVDESGFVSSDGNVNVNGSMHNIEGIVSADGRIIGKMGHSERIGQFVHKNIPGNKDQKLFESGVNYFK
ncbi:MAG: phosphoribosylformylglycinamidine synthase [Candidatus Cellulosilyticum pullistercoris]|uniref:Phosphoribosylformylglycinamidine synthase n=1 Tax=Candidatus Cellulosilyticum pullistercoris TaxID=2838521 RepID=A0A9E2NKN8_9FIRM|nr:phosphoribosylformylglycinamidine synthase [Candidatus Cellulosilyticum pullistercoris]